MATHDVGDLVRITGTFTDAAGIALDPAVVKCTYRVPGQAAVTLIYLVDAALVRDDTGIYHVDLSATVAGRYAYRFWSTGSGQAAGESWFNVRASAV